MVNLGGTGVQIVISAVDNFSKVFNKAKLSMDNFRKAAAGFAVVGSVIAAGFAKAIQTSISFESAFAGVRKTVELSEAEFADLENRFKTLTTEIPQTFEELSAIGEIAGQLGVEGVDDLEAFTKTIAAIGVTTNLTTEEAATGFARIANIMQVPITNVDNMGSAVVDLGNNFATTEKEILTFAKRIAGAGKIAGLSVDDTFAIGAAFSSVGIEAESGGTAVQKVLLAMNDAVINGGDKLTAFAETAGVSSDEFKKSFEKDAGQAFANFVTGLGDMGNMAGSRLDELGLKDQRLIRSFLSLANAGDLINETMDKSNKAFEANTALTEEAEQRYATLESQLDIAKNKFALLGDQIGDTMAPLITDILIPAIDKLLGFWESLSPVMQESILIFGAVTVAVSAVAAAVAALTLVSSPWLLIIAAAILAITAIIVVIRNWNDMTTKTKLILLSLFPVLAGIILITKNWDLVVKLFQNRLKQAGISFGIFKNIALIVWESIKFGIASSVNFIVNAVESMAQKIINAINSIIEGMNAIPGVQIPIIPALDLSNFNIETGGMQDRIKELTSNTKKLIEEGKKLNKDFIETSMEIITGSGSEGRKNAISNGEGIMSPIEPNFTPVNGNMTVNIEQINGTNPDDMAEALQEKLQSMISTG